LSISIEKCPLSASKNYSPKIKKMLLISPLNFQSGNQGSSSFFCSENRPKCSSSERKKNTWADFRKNSYFNDTDFLEKYLAAKVGRLHRNYDSKKEVLIYDYVDEQIPMLQKMYKKRLLGYKAIGYEVKEKL